MNVFVLDHDLTKNAEYHCDSHCIKLILESAQLACTTHRLQNTQNLPNLFYKSTHVHHPLVKWIQKSTKHYSYVVNYGLALCKEYSYRYRKVHKTQSLLECLKHNAPQMPNVNFVDQPQCMPKQYQIQGNVLQAYRNYYKFEKKNKIRFKYTKRQIPHWLKEEL